MLTPAELQTRIDAVLGKLDAVIDVWNTSAAPAYTITYQFETAQPPDQATQFAGWTPLTLDEKAAIRAAMNEFEAVLNIRFVEVTGSADPDMNVGRVDLPPGIGGQGGNSISYSTSNGQVTSRTYDGYAVFDAPLSGPDGAQLILHEIGHFLSLKHPGDYDGSPPPYLPPAEESNKFSVMSYNVNPTNGLKSDNLMVYDIASLQHRWGANLAARTGNDIYTAPDGGRIQAIWDARGSDTIDASAQAGAVTIDLRQGNFSSVGATDNFIIAYGTVIENAKGGAGNDTLLGNSSANMLTGNGGADTLKGGGGNDVYVNPVIGPGGDRITEVNSPAGGTHDRILTLSSFNLNTVLYIEDITLAGAANVNAIGDNFANILAGNGGNNVINGGGGADTITGGGGNDRMNGGVGADLFRFATAGTGADRIDGFERGLDRFDLSGGLFSDRIEGGGNTTLVHAGGTILVVGVTGLNLAAWNTRIIDGTRGHHDAVYTPTHDIPLGHTPLGHVGGADFLFA